MEKITLFDKTFRPFISNEELEKAIDKARTKAASGKTAEERKQAADDIYQMECELPEVPTMREAGLPEYEVVAWFGLFAPAGTPLLEGTPSVVAPLPACTSSESQCP